jgi:hypothetical protein
MDPVQKIWMYQNWIEDQNDRSEQAKNHAYLLASFWNPEAVKKILSDEGKHESTDSDFEESLRMVKEANKSTEVKRKRRRKLKE